MSKTIEEFKKSVDTYRKVVDLLNSILENTEKNDLEKALKLTGLDNCELCSVGVDGYDVGLEEGNAEGYAEGKEAAEEQADEEFTIQLNRLAKHFKISLCEIKKIAEN